MKGWLPKNCAAPERLKCAVLLPAEKLPGEISKRCQCCDSEHHSPNVLDLHAAQSSTASTPGGVGKSFRVLSHYKPGFFLFAESLFFCGAER